MILNGLGFVSAPLSLFERFFEGKATEHLIGPGVRPEHQLHHQLTQWSAQDFRCEADALLAADRFAKHLKYHCLEAVNLTKHSQHKKPGRPRKDAQPQVNYRIEATVYTSPS
jgi:transposase